MSEFVKHVNITALASPVPLRLLDVEALPIHYPYLLVYHLLLRNVLIIHHPFILH